MLAKFCLYLVLALATLAACDPRGHKWHHPRPRDRKVKIPRSVTTGSSPTLQVTVRVPASMPWPTMVTSLATG